MSMLTDDQRRRLLALTKLKEVYAEVKQRSKLSGTFLDFSVQRSILKDIPKGKLGNDREFCCLLICIVVAVYLYSPPRTILDGFFDDYNPEYSPMGLRLGKDEVVFVLRNDDPLRATFQGLEKRPLDTPSFVEPRPSPLHGWGLFATKDLQPGDLVFSERPLVSAINVET
jgi:hypothetical protein